MSLASMLYVAQIASTLPLVGLIWTIQVVHYPLFGAVGTAGFPRYHALHATRISRIVVPLMLIELVSVVGSVLVVDAPGPALLGPGMAWAGLAAVFVVWATTFLISVPLHRRLGAGFDPRAHRALVVTNWLRTAAWTARGISLVVAMAGSGLAA